MSDTKFPIFQDGELKNFTCVCGLNYFRVTIKQGSIKQYLWLECPACGQIITEDLNK